MAIKKNLPEELMTDEQQARLKHLRNLLTKPDMEKKYLEKKAKYDKAYQTYNIAKTEAMRSKNSKAVHNCAINGNLLQLEVKAAMKDWVSVGYKNEYEQISAEISQLQIRSVV